MSAPGSLTGGLAGRYPMLTEPVHDVATTQSLIAALQATMQPAAANKRGVVVIPGARKGAPVTRKLADEPSPLALHTRHGIVMGAVVIIVFVSMLTMSPLSARGSSPLFQSVIQWVQSQQLAWNLDGHVMSMTQNQDQADTTGNMPVPPPMNLPKSQYVALARQAAINAGIPPDYFVRQINAESGFNPYAVSPSGAVGIAQFMPSTAAGMGVNPYDPVSALNGAARYMANYYHQYGNDYAKALAAYNAGSGTVDNAIRLGGAAWMNYIPPETRNYINRIMGI
ncbi:lytic transglycosylase domain-containing protein [Ktedonosporobacter rubrisoli]|uniref:Lytic transglycosylase domain-containing protein n=2 Tax=Ktedonosporobacter rubrisoli TaxID=2509675 RepID=A0A4P6K5P9_KTERU|nr:lytic transglycosylase domain-containing protein [Ktedonosporobacter rubrisoli]